MKTKITTHNSECRKSYTNN